MADASYGAFTGTRDEMVLVTHVALVSESRAITAAEAARVAAAIQTQVTRDFAPIWEVHATVAHFPSRRDVPTGYWPVVVADTLDDPNALGYHADENGQPYALVEHTEEWSLTASHETLEMLADPFGNRTTVAPSVKRGQRDVQYLVEVCDPCETAQSAYEIDGVTVSDFYTPAFFDAKKAAGVRYSFTGAISAPRTILRGGYMSWLDPKTNHLWQQIWIGTTKQFRDLGPATAPLRAQVDRATRGAEARARATRRSRRS